VGYWDDWKVMSTFRDTKILLSLCLCIQLFKLLKFLEMMVPKLGLATDVLRKCLIELLFFGISFVISMLAFSMMLYIQLGPFMATYINNEASFISIARALFGDFDIDEILDNSKDYLNAILFICYLFIAIFIMLSMFLAILADAQVAIKDYKENRPREIAVKEDGWSSEFGIIAASKSLLDKYVPCCRAKEDAEEEEEDPEGDVQAQLKEIIQKLSAPAVLEALQREFVSAASAAGDDQPSDQPSASFVTDLKELKDEFREMKQKTVLVNFAAPTVGMMPSSGPSSHSGSRLPPPPPPPPPGPPPQRAGDAPPRQSV